MIATLPANVVNRDCYFTNPHDPMISFFFMFQGTACVRVDLLSWVGLSFFYVFIQFYVHLLIVHIWQKKLLKQSLSCKTARHRSRCLTSEIFFLPTIIMIKDPFPCPLKRTRSCLLEAFLMTWGKAQIFTPLWQSIRGASHT